MKKLIAIFGVLILSMMTSYGYRLVDYDTFDQYTPWALGGNFTTFITEGAGKWNCSDTVAYPTCSRDGTVYGSGGYANWNIGQDFGGNQYMTMISIDGVCGGSPEYKNLGLAWYHTNSSLFSAFSENQSYVLRYAMKMVYAQNATGCGGTMNSLFARLEDPKTLIMGASTQLYQGLGGQSLCSPFSEDCFQRLRTWYNTGTYMQPVTSNCTVNDGNWHVVKTIYKVDTSRILYNWTTYIDGIQCESRSPMSSMGAATVPMFPSPIKFHTQGLFSWAIDNVSLFESNISEGFDGEAALPLYTPPYTTCDTYDPPIYLQESFNGYLSDCGWFTTHNLFNAGQLSITAAQTPYVQSKSFSDITRDMSQYATLKFDLNIVSVANGSYSDIRMYDYNFKNFWLFYIGGTPLTIYTTKAGVATTVTTINSSTTYTYMVVVNLQGQTYDAYLNGVKIASNYQFSDASADIQDIYAFKFASLSSQLTLDNILIYTSDVNGNQLTPGSVTPGIINNGTQWCGLFYKSTPTCTLDSDCATGDCMPNNRCNSFNMKYCDQHGMVRGNKCISGAMASCAFSSTAAVVFDNFLYVLIGLLALLAITYFTIMLRRRGQ